ncbi:SIR2 family protein [Salinibacterium sp. SWN248]|uniref:SIR2 family protein n=1 Tax=Salinibacterium sp. SWN248 TaxID=2792056 RepID=UPI0018CD9899|nr:SIR2 family protein [Salinibacterium sp. SWN248]MBH0024432.1 SIR2 family protein [Salinibacterium sp. SWN248]
MTAEWQSDGIALPAELEQALKTNTLVLFCGAGISAAPPSCLPGFRGLVEAVGSELGRSDLLPADPNAPVQFDAVMGELNELQHDVHARVSARLRTTTQPNSYHRNLLRIGQSQADGPRIVTTNFDLLFENSAREIGQSLPVYTAPALPLGDDFSGLVHLHGSIDSASGQRMVVTDTDFGQAYITEGWATQFLTRMFERYVTLFVGYSADDTVMRYLTRALPADGKTRFAFIEAGQRDSAAARWGRLGVTPIPYPSPEEAPHASLELFIENWRKRLTGTSVERFDRIRAILADGPDGQSLPEHELLWLLSDAEHSRHFRNGADAASWIPRLDALGVLDKLFDASALDSDDDVGWALWAASSFASDDGAALLTAAARHGGRLGRALWFQIWLCLFQGYRRGEQHRQWLLMLAADQSSRDIARLSSLLREVAEKDASAAEVLLHHLLIPQLQFRAHRGWLDEGDSLDAEMVLALQQSSIRDAWPTLLPSLTGPDHLLSVVLDLIRGAESTATLFSGHDRRHVLSARRRRVDGVDQYGREDPYVLVVDIARDLLREFVRSEGPGRPLQLLTSSSELIRRLALDSLAEAQSSMAEAMLNLLVDRNLIFDTPYKPEVFRLLKVMYRHASLGTKSHLLAHVEQQVGCNNETEVRDYERYNVLLWLSADMAEEDPVHATLSAAKTAHPDYAPRDFPDVDFGFSIGSHEESNSEVEGLFRGRPMREVVAALAGDSTLDDVYDNGPVLRELRDYLDQKPSDVLGLLDEFLGQKLHSAAAWTVALQSAVHSQSRWRSAPLLKRLQQLELSVDEIAHQLVHSVTRPSSEEGKPLGNPKERCRFLLGLWRLVSIPESDEPATDPSEAHATARGALAYAYVETALRATQERENSSIDTELLEGFDELLAAQGVAAADPSAMMLARYAGYIVDMAPEWSDLNLKPRLSAIDGSPRSLSFWAGVLTSNYFSSSLMTRTRDALRIGWPEISKTLPASVEAFIEIHAAQFCFYTSADEHTWADPFMALAPVKTRVRWIRSVARHLDGKDPTFQELLFEHWRHRLDGQPPIHGAEQRSLLYWLLLPNINLDLAVDLFVRGPVVAPTVEDQGFDYYDLNDFPRDNNTAFLRVGLHLLKGRTRLPSFLNLLVEAATEAGEQDSARAHEVWSRLLSLGYTPARAHLGSPEVDGSDGA